MKGRTGEIKVAKWKMHNRVVIKKVNKHPDSDNKHFFYEVSRMVIIPRLLNFSLNANMKFLV